jgi:hypothetical protein
LATNEGFVFSKIQFSKIRNQEMNCQTFFTYWSVRFDHNAFFQWKIYSGIFWHFEMKNRSPNSILHSQLMARWMPHKKISFIFVFVLLMFLLWQKCVKLVLRNKIMSMKLKLHALAVNCSHLDSKKTSILLILKRLSQMTETLFEHNTESNLYVHMVGCL